MTATARLITSDELVVIGVEEHNAERNALAFQGIELIVEIGEIIFIAGIANHGKFARKAVCVIGGHNEQLPQQARGQVIDAEIAQIFKGVHSFGATRAAHARNDDQVVRALAHLAFNHRYALPSTSYSPRAHSDTPVLSSIAPSAD